MGLGLGKKRLCAVDKGEDIIALFWELLMIFKHYYDSR